MNTYYFIYDVDPQIDNPVIGHVSRAVVHVWVLAAGLQEARETTLNFLKSELWNIGEEKDGYLLTPEQIEALAGEERSKYQSAQTAGIETKFYYWHRAE